MLPEGVFLLSASNRPPTLAKFGPVGRLSSWQSSGWHGPVDRTRCLLPTTSHLASLNTLARCVELCNMATCPCPLFTAVAVVAQTPIRRSAVQTRGLEQTASRTRHSFQSELHHAQRPTLQHLICLFFLFLGFLDLLASKPLIRLPALLTARLLLHHHVLICLTHSSLCCAEILGSLKRPILHLCFLDSIVV